MKKTIIMLLIGLTIHGIAQAQGTTYLSNLGQLSASSNAVGGDMWLGYSFKTGPDVNGYTLDSVQLGMADATGNPKGFTVMLYSAVTNAEYYPGGNLDTLSGSSNPSTAGIYTYSPVSNVILSPSTTYFIVLTSGTVIASGAYEWSLGSTLSYSPSGGWSAPVGFARPDNYQSINGSTWAVSQGYAGFAITATPIPEPSILSLVGLSGLLFIRYCRKQR